MDTNPYQSPNHTTASRWSISPWKVFVVVLVLVFIANYVFMAYVSYRSAEGGRKGSQEFREKYGP
jgi:hypothetical protein